ncbi:hypothetical protein HZH66_009173 [Vespula vulgaris]|uniref:Uncharacterized protein n=1 Tax=Vespula vulgaris TaxID=7454 RepID=A0A834JSJ7_VESVU|nr:hypothetical protein HZH66_009173 [Vespula vulgaris]
MAPPLACLCAAGFFSLIPNHQVPGVRLIAAAFVTATHPCIQTHSIKKHPQSPAQPASNLYSAPLHDVSGQPQLGLIDILTASILPT